MNKDNTEIIGKQAAALSLIEIGLGSLLHSMKVPLTGHLLSINQIAFLSRNTFKLNSKKVSLQISLVASLLKCLSPAGKKLTPMLAISAQGLFFYLGIILFGINYFGLAVAVFFASVWAYVQSVLFVYLVFGGNSIDVANFLIKEFEKIVPHAAQFLIWIVIIFVLIKWVVALTLSITAIKLSDAEFEQFQKKIILEIKPQKVQPKKSALYLSLLDTLNPLFIVSFILTSLFFLFSNSSQSTTQIIWQLLRPLAVAFILFYVVRVFPVEKASQYLFKKGYNQLGKILDTAIKTVQNIRGL